MIRCKSWSFGCIKICRYTFSMSATKTYLWQRHRNSTSASCDNKFDLPSTNQQVRIQGNPVFDVEQAVEHHTASSCCWIPFLRDVINNILVTWSACSTRVICSSSSYCCMKFAYETKGPSRIDSPCARAYDRPLLLRISKRFGSGASTGKRTTYQPSCARACIRTNKSSHLCSSDVHGINNGCISSCSQKRRTIVASGSACTEQSSSQVSCHFVYSSWYNLAQGRPLSARELLPSWCHDW